MSTRIHDMEKTTDEKIGHILNLLTTMKVKLDILCNNYQSDVHDRLKLKSLFVKYNEEESK
mgnify:CR=1 FL=1